METSFELDHAKLATDPRFAGISEKLSTLSPIDSRATFNRYCREASRLWQRQFPDGIGETEQFAGFLGRLTIMTSWGGVVVTLHEHPLVEKFLVVREGGYLALEMHEEKDEHLTVQEGAGLVLFREPGARTLTAQVMLPNERFHFAPGIEHCIIGTEDLLVFERATDPKGMDQDLIFIYEPDVR